jgi:hypothetical protein
MSTLLRRAIWVLPAWCVAALALLFHAPLWKASVVTRRSGFMATVPAHVLLVALPTLTVLYALTFTWLMRTMAHGGRGLRQPTDTEIGCAVWLLRAMLVVLLYVFAFWAFCT